MTPTPPAAGKSPRESTATALEPSPGEAAWSFSWLRVNTCFLTSLCVHVALLLLLAILVIPAQSHHAVSLELVSADEEGIDEPLADDLPLEFAELSAETELPEFEEPESELWDAAAPLSLDLEPEAAESLEPSPLSPSSFGDSLQPPGSASGGENAPSYDDLLHRLAREGGGTGQVQISLAWNNYNDLDLHVICPSGEEIYYGYNESLCGGVLDIDMNVSPHHSLEPVENIFWPPGGAPEGRYRVIVHHFKNHRQPDPTDFSVAVKIGGEVVLLDGEISYSDRKIEMYSFVIGQPDESTAPETEKERDPAH